MIRFVVISLVSALLLIGCRDQKKPAPPADLISKEQFIAIMSDIRLLEGAYTTRYARVDTSALKIESYYLKLFQDHSVSPERFNTSYTWYSADQSKMLEIEEAVVQRITEMQSVVVTDTTQVNKVVGDTLAPKVRVQPQN